MAGKTRMEPQRGPRARRPARVIVTPVDRTHHHPLSKRDVQRVLAALPDDSVVGLRSVSLLDELIGDAGRPVLGSYRPIGFVRLHAVPRAPWHVASLPASETADLERYGARVTRHGNVDIVSWTPAALRVFYVAAVLLPGIARHHRERLGLHEFDQNVRVLGEPGDWIVTDLALRQWERFLDDGRTRARAAEA